MGVDLAPAPDPLTRIWERMARPFDVPEAVDAILGLPPPIVRQLVGSLTANSTQATELLDHMPKSIRSLATSMNSSNERCVGELRGPIMWSETMSARSASNGDEGVFVCATPSRAYDITENRVLVAGLQIVFDAAIDAAAVGDKVYDDESLRSARHAGERARKWLQHPSLRSVTHERPSGRALKRTRSGKSRKSYEPALAMLERAGEPLQAADLLPFCDQRTRVQHDVLMRFVDLLEQGGSRLPPFRAEKGIIYSGPVQYYHPRTLGNRERLSGILLGGLLVDVPDRLRETNRARADEELQGRAGNRRSMVIMEPADITAAFELAISLARG